MRNYAFLTIILVLVICTYVFGEAPPVQRWVARYNNPYDSYDAAKALAVDSSGNVYVTGESDGGPASSDYVTIKYASDGNQVWERRYNGPGNDSDNPYGLEIDNWGNIYVAGYSEGNGTDTDYAVVKYSPDGNQIWVGRYNGPANDFDNALALVVDDAGNAYVTGQSQGGATSCDYATVKFSPDGNQLWAARYNHPPSNYDSPHALAVDKWGNVCVTGFSRDPYGRDYATVKYDSNGNQLWVARHDGGDATAVVIDDAGQVYVTGFSGSGGSGSYDFATIKYSPDGNELWVAHYNGPGNGSDYATALAVDSSGNVYVTGESAGSGTGYDYATVKYDSNGNQLWLARYNGPVNGTDAARDLAVDDLGNVYVSGGSFGSGTSEYPYDYATVKYDPNGNQLWVVRYDGPANDSDEVYDLEMDDSGNVYVTGRSKGIDTGHNDYATIKYTQHDYCLGPVFGDFNGDCRVDFEDFAVFALHWLECNYALQEDCW